MASPETRRRLSSLGLFVLPLVAVKLASVVMGGPSPSGAAASPAQPAEQNATAGAAGVTMTPPVQWTAAQRAAADHVRYLTSTTFGPSPMLYAATPKPPEVQEPDPVLAEQPKPAEIPAFELQAIMNSASGDKAVINGRPYLVGQSVEKAGWTVRSIDVGSRSVVLVENGGAREITITVHRRD